MGAEKEDGFRVSEPCRAEGKDFAENGPGRVDWHPKCQAEELPLNSADCGLAPEGSALDPLLRTCVHCPWLEGDSHIPALVQPHALQHISAEKVPCTRHTPGGNNGEVTSDCVFKSLAVWGQGKERQRGRLDKDSLNHNT